MIQSFHTLWIMGPEELGALWNGYPKFTRPLNLSNFLAFIALRFEMKTH